MNGLSFEVTNDCAGCDGVVPANKGSLLAGVSEPATPPDDRGLGRKRELEQGADLLLRGAKSLENLVGEPDRHKQKTELNKKAAELIPISLEPIAKSVMAVPRG